MPPALEMRGITKSFAGNSVLAGVSLRAAAGEVHALVGENGAGKSTLMKILAGVYRPDGGEILIEGGPVHFTKPADALAHGVAMIYQELSLAPHLTVAENIFLGREPVRFKPLGVLDKRGLNERAARLLRDQGFRLDPRAAVGRLSAADRQLVEITRATAEARRVVVMDEPTSSLTAHEAAELFRLIRDLRRRGLAVVYISPSSSRRAPRGGARSCCASRTFRARASSRASRSRRGRARSSASRGSRALGAPNWSRPSSARSRSTAARST